MFDQITADAIAELQAKHRESDFKCAVRSGMSERAAREYAATMALHPSRGGPQPMSVERIEFLVDLIAGHDLGGDELANELRACLTRDRLAHGSSK